jgi:hypothetical protein
MVHLYIGASSRMKFQKVSAGLVQLFVVFHAGSLVLGDAPSTKEIE